MWLGVGRGWMKRCKPNKYQHLTAPAPHSPSALRSQRGTGLLKTNPLMSRAGLSGQGGAATVLLSSPAPVEQVSPPGSKLFVDSGGLPSVKRKAFSLSHLACDVSQDLVGLWENMGCTEKPNEQGAVYFMDDGGSLTEMWQQCNQHSVFVQI